MIAALTGLLPGGLLVRALVVALVIGAAYAAGQIHGRGAVYAKWNAQIAEAAATATKIITRQGEITTQVVTRWKERQAEIQTITQTIEKEVPRYVTPAADPVLPLGWRLLHDAAAYGAVPQAAAGIDVAAPDIAASQAASAVIGNYMSCHTTAAQLEALQAWVRHQYETTNLEPLRYPP